MVVIIGLGAMCIVSFLSLRARKACAFSEMIVNSHYSQMLVFSCGAVAPITTVILFGMAIVLIFGRLLRIMKRSFNAHIASTLMHL